MSDTQAIDILDDLLGGMPMPTNPAKGPTPAPFSAQPTPIVPAQPATAQAQAVPGVSGGKGPQTPNIPSVVDRSTIVKDDQGKVIDLSVDGSFEDNLAKLLVKDLELAQHDRSMAIALFQTHLDRAEVLDQMQLSMPVATVISDNTGATLKSLELAMKAGERVHKVAELLVTAQKNGDAAALAALKAKGSNNDWGTEDLPT